LGAHREAAAQFALALRFADGLPTEERIDLLERRSYECYLTGETREAIDARRRALEEHRARGDLLRTGDAHRWLSRLAWFEGDRASAEREAEQAIALLEQVPPSRELAMAYSNQSQLGMLARDLDGALTWGRRALELAQRLDEQEIVVHALNNVGTAELQADPAGGAKTLERGLELALAAGFEEHAARAYTNLGAASIDARVYNQGDEALAAGISYCRERDLDAWWRYMTSWVARSHLEQGRWDDAAQAAAAVLDRPGVAAPSRINALVVIGRLRARRGDPDVWGPLDEAGEFARSAAEVQRQGPVAAARAEARWLAGEPDLIGEETEEALALALAHEHEWVAGELYAWRRRAGISVPEPAYAAEPFRLELDGHPEQAAAAWRRLGCPYEAALALLESDDESELRRSLAELQELGARPAAARVARALRERGARDLPRGPHAATRANPAGLTPRELEVLELLVQGKRNAQIAGQLVLSEKTVGHHVSAILRKLGVSTRTEAATQARLLGIVER
jgi:DNA-binding CsgD family transcriptional regulator